MYFQIDQTNFVNKGAELMMHSIIQRLTKEESLNSKFVLGPGLNNDKSFVQIRKNGLFHIFKYQRFKFRLDRLMDQKRLDRFGLVKEDSINILLDAGGFQFGDQWNNYYSKENNLELKKYYKSHKLNGVKIILLPQAFGPFQETLSKDRIKYVYENVDLIYARDSVSYNNLINLLGQSTKIRQAPDFTILTKPDISYKLYVQVKDAVCVIPNAKMLTHTDKDISNNYISFLINISNYFLKKREKLVFLNHEDEGDFEIINKISSHLIDDVIILNGLDGLTVKGVIGHVKLLISSRFHGVVSGLNQLIPTFCTSWSHKYQELAKLYDMDNLVLDVNDNSSVNLKIIEENISKVISCQKQIELENQTERMWDEIIEFIQQ
jgi:polysaccharide pyruvyl transferase WcaK-like protein